MATRDRERTRERDNYEEIIAHQRAERERSSPAKSSSAGGMSLGHVPPGVGEALHVALAL